MAKVKDTAKKSPHKNRKYKTCDCGFVGYGHKDFPIHWKGKCINCVIEDHNGGPCHDEWDRWAKAEIKKFLKFYRRFAKEKVEPWERWATRKSVTISNRSNMSIGNIGNRRIVSNWEDLIRIGMQRLNRRNIDRTESTWNRKCRSWARSLNMRERMQAGKRSES